jgi:hypothetical protein
MSSLVVFVERALFTFAGIPRSLSESSVTPACGAAGKFVFHSKAE